MTLEERGGGAGWGQEDEGEECDVSHLLYLAQHARVTRGSSPPHSSHGGPQGAYCVF